MLILLIFYFRGWEGHYWALPDESHLRQLMRYAAENKDEVRRRGERARITMLQNYSLMKIGVLVAAQLERIQESFVKVSEDSLSSEL